MNDPILIYIATLIVYYLIYVSFTMGLNLSFGMAGILDFAFITFMAVGAYIGGVVALGPQEAGSGITYILGLNWPWPIGLLLGAAAAALIGVLIGLIAMRRLRADYMAIVMVSMWTIAWDTVGNTTELFNGQAGLINVPQPLASWFDVNPNTYVYVFIVITAVVAIILTVIAWRIQHSAFGNVIRSIREDQDVAEAFGKPVLKYRLKAMAIACAFAGVGGALTVEFVQGINPSGWAIVETFIIFSALLVGGRGNVWGALLGAFVVRIVIIEGSGILPIFPDHPELVGPVRNMIIGAMLIAVLYFRPQGLLPERPSRFAREKKLRSWRWPQLTQPGTPILPNDHMLNDSGALPTSKEASK